MAHFQHPRLRFAGVLECVEVVDARAPSPAAPAAGEAARMQAVERTVLVVGEWILTCTPSGVIRKVLSVRELDREVSVQSLRYADGTVQHVVRVTAAHHTGEGGGGGDGLGLLLQQRGRKDCIEPMLSALERTRASLPGAPPFTIVPQPPEVDLWDARAIGPCAAVGRVFSADWSPVLVERRRSPDRSLSPQTRAGGADRPHRASVRFSEDTSRVPLAAPPLATPHASPPTPPRTVLQSSLRSGGGGAGAGAVRASPGGGSTNTHAAAAAPFSGAAAAATAATAAATPHTGVTIPSEDGADMDVLLSVFETAGETGGGRTEAARARGRVDRQRTSPPPPPHAPPRPVYSTRVDGLYPLEAGRGGAYGGGGRRPASPTGYSEGTTDTDTGTGTGGPASTQPPCYSASSLVSNGSSQVDGGEDEVHAAYSTGLVCPPPSQVHGGGVPQSFMGGGIGRAGRRPPRGAGGGSHAMGALQQQPQQPPCPPFEPIVEPDVLVDLSEVLRLHGVDTAACLDNGNGGYTGDAGTLPFAEENYPYTACTPSPSRSPTPPAASSPRAARVGSHHYSPDASDDGGRLPAAFAGLHYSPASIARVTPRLPAPAEVAPPPGPPHTPGAVATGGGDGDRDRWGGGAAGSDTQGAPAARKPICRIAGSAAAIPLSPGAFGGARHPRVPRQDPAPLEAAPPPPPHVHPLAVSPVARSRYLLPTADPQVRYPSGQGVGRQQQQQQASTTSSASSHPSSAAGPPVPRSASPPAPPPRSTHDAWAALSQGRSRVTYVDVPQRHTAAAASPSRPARRMPSVEGSEPRNDASDGTTAGIAGWSGAVATDYYPPPPSEVPQVPPQPAASPRTSRAMNYPGVRDSSSSPLSATPSSPAARPALPFPSVLPAPVAQIAGAVVGRAPSPPETMTSMPSGSSASSSPETSVREAPPPPLLGGRPGDGSMSVDSRGWVREHGEGRGVAAAGSAAVVLLSSSPDAGRGPLGYPPQGHAAVPRADGVDPHGAACSGAADRTTRPPHADEAGREAATMSDDDDTEPLLPPTSSALQSFFEVPHDAIHAVANLDSVGSAPSAVDEWFSDPHAGDAASSPNVPGSPRAAPPLPAPAHGYEPLLSAARRGVPQRGHTPPPQQATQQLAQHTPPRMALKRSTPGQPLSPLSPNMSPAQALRMRYGHLYSPQGAQRQAALQGRAVASIAAWGMGHSPPPTAASPVPMGLAPLQAPGGTGGVGSAAGDSGTSGDDGGSLRTLLSIAEGKRMGVGVARVRPPTAQMAGEHGHGPPSQATSDGASTFSTATGATSAAATAAADDARVEIKLSNGSTAVVDKERLMALIMEGQQADPGAPPPPSSSPPRSPTPALFPPRQLLGIV